MRKLNISVLLLYMLVSSISMASEAQQIFSNLNFKLDISYSSDLIRKFDKSGEKIKVVVWIDQFGEKYMEEEAIAYREITSTLKDKIAVRGVPLSDANYIYKRGKRYMVTVEIISARDVYTNNILNCFEYPEVKDMTIEDIQDSVVYFKCKLLR